MFKNAGDFAQAVGKLTPAALDMLTVFAIDDALVENLEMNKNTALGGVLEKIREVLPEVATGNIKDPAPAVAMLYEAAAIFEKAADRDLSDAEASTLLAQCALILGQTPASPSAVAVASAGMTEQPPAKTGATGIPTHALDDPELYAEFIFESGSHLDAIENKILALEQSPDDIDIVNDVFRTFHTIKGTSGFLAVSDITRLAHDAENLLDAIRGRKMVFTPEIGDVLLMVVDQFKILLANLEGSLARRPDFVPVEVPIDDSIVRINRLMGKVSLMAGPERAAAERPATDEAARRSSAAAREAIKVDLGKLDSLINLAGELVITRSQVEQAPCMIGIADRDFKSNVERMGKIVADIQDLAMRMRMVPIRPLFQKMMRLVRDLAKRNGKDIELVLSGEDTELDKTVIEELGDPLVHLIRNACDHGIEPSAERTAAGKSPTGRIDLRASHMAGDIVIEISDDGRGLDREKILAKALKSGLIADERGVTDNEIYQMIFRPGFSTAGRVTDISGRGVGMDVVKRNIERLRGRVEIETRPGRGSSFYVKLPLTLAIIEGMLIQVGGDRYVLPTVAVRQSFMPKKDEIAGILGREQVVAYRNEELPIVALGRLFESAGYCTNAHEAMLIVVEGANRRFALLVDKILGRQQIVIKSLGRALRNLASVSGSAVLGDGTVGLILDVDGIRRLALKKEFGNEN